MDQFPKSPFSVRWAWMVSQIDNFQRGFHLKSTRGSWYSGGIAVFSFAETSSKPCILSHIDLQFKITPPLFNPGTSNQTVKPLISGCLHTWQSTHWKHRWYTAGTDQTLQASRPAFASLLPTGPLHDNSSLSLSLSLVAFILDYPLILMICQNSQIVDCLWPVSLYLLAFLSRSGVVYPERLCLRFV